MEESKKVIIGEVEEEESFFSCVVDVFLLKLYVIGVLYFYNWSFMIT